VSPIRSDDSDVEEYLKDVTERVHTYEDTKLASLYTDYANGSFSSPDEIFRRDLAKAMLGLAEKRLSIINQIEKATSGKIKDFDVAKIDEIRKSLFNV
jgi:hypothetical protein